MLDERLLGPRGVCGDPIVLSATRSRTLSDQLRNVVGFHMSVPDLEPDGPFHGKEEQKRGAIHGRACRPQWASPTLRF